jgi:hypothetical protein
VIGKGGNESRDEGVTSDICKHRTFVIDMINLLELDDYAGG